MEDKLCQVEVLPPVPPESALDVEKVNGELEDIVVNFKYQRCEIERSIARLGTLMLRIQEQKFWVELGFSSWGSFCEDVRSRLELGRTQLFQYVSVARSLLPVMSEDELAEIGITKAIELKKYSNLTGKRPSTELIAYSKHCSVAETRARIFLECHGIPAEKQKYFDLGGFYCTDDEKEEIEYVFSLAAQVDPPISSELSEPARKKEVILRLVQEFRSTYDHTI